MEALHTDRDVTVRCHSLFTDLSHVSVSLRNTCDDLAMEQILEGRRLRAVGALRRLDLAVVGLSLLVAGPVLGAGVRLVASGWTPTADDAFIVTRSFDVFSSRPPLTGAHSLVGAAGTPVHSPGPMLYLLLAVPVRLGLVWLLPLFIATVNALALAWAIWLARRRGGVVFACLVAVGSVLLVRSIGPSSMASIWNPAVGRIPLLLLGFLVWSVLDGEQRLLPAVVLVGSFTLQAHLSFGPPSVALLAVALVAGVLYASREAVESRWRPLLLAGLVLAGCWALPVYEQVTRDPGNLQLVVDSGRSDAPRAGAEVAVAATGRAVGVPPGFSRSEEAVNASTAATFEGRSVGDVVAVSLAVALLVAIVGGAGWTQRRHLWSGGLVALVLLAAVAATASRFPRNDVLVAFYAFKWFAIAGLFVWIIAALAVGETVGKRWWAAGRPNAGADPAESVRPPAATVVAGLLACTLVGGLLAFALPGTDVAASAYEPAEQIGDAVVAATEPGGRYLIGQSGPYDIGFTSVLGYRLRSSGRIPVTSGAVVNALGEAYRLSGRRCDGIIVLQPSAESVPVNGRTLTVVDVPTPTPTSTDGRMRVLLVSETVDSNSC